MAARPAHEDRAKLSLHLPSAIPTWHCSPCSRDTRLFLCFLHLVCIVPRAFQADCFFICPYFYFFAGYFFPRPPPLLHPPSLVSLSVFFLMASPADVNSPQANEQWKTEKYKAVTNISENIEILSEQVRKTTELQGYMDDFVEEVEVEKLEKDLNMRIEDLSQRLHLALFEETKKLNELCGGMKKLQDGLKDSLDKEIKQLKLEFQEEIEKLRKNLKIRPKQLLGSNQSLDKTIKFLGKTLEVIEKIATKPWVNAKVRIPDFQILTMLPSAPCEGYEIIADKRSFESLPFGEQTVFLTRAALMGYNLLLENLDSSSDEEISFKCGRKVPGDPASSSTAASSTTTAETPSTTTTETPKEGNYSFICAD
ncbi:hypothetical protein ACLOJK_014495 [Asimina triloba]